MQYVGLDFETANSAPESACSIGIGVFNQDKLQQETEIFIKPPAGFDQFHRFNTYIHGIHKQDVEDALHFDQIWPRIQQMIEGNLIICHNAAFDIQVLRRLLQHYQLNFNPFYYICTVKISQKVWPEMENHKLNTVSNHLQISLHHHHAASDAIAAGYIFLKALEETESKDVFELAKILGLQVGYVSPEQEIKCSVRRSRTNYKRI
jgi:DNA polymerase-3 subunit epsilon